MLCTVCVRLIRGGQGRILEASTLDPKFAHHATTTTLRQSAEADCSICIALASVILKEPNCRQDQPLSIQVSISHISISAQEDSYFCLDFKLEEKTIRTFVLKPINPSTRRLRNLQCSSTASTESFKLACQWMSQCKCANFWKKSGKKWYPRRLLDLEELRNADVPKDWDGLAIQSNSHRFANIRIRLVESADVRMHERTNNRYVTLSHCWGPPEKVGKTLRLCVRTEQTFKREGIALSKLSKTFLESMLFASHLKGVGYIWIDSLCIKQRVNLEEDSLDDWREQSRFMEEIYRRSYLNISATAASDGDQGIFFARRPELLRQNEIDVNHAVVDISGATTIGKAKTDPFTRCTLVDVSFWDDLVQEAPINRRGWVFQERLLAPRVLHFCHNQIAWECSEFSDAEGHHEKGSILRTRSGDISDEGRFKSLTKAEGLALRKLRLKGYPDPDKHMKRLHVYELWKRIVEAYSGLSLTVSSDKLMALAGIAKAFSRDTKCKYVVGMWREHLESQLLWEVREVYHDGVFQNLTRRQSARAPSFSWASVDGPCGILYGEVTDYGKDRSEELFLEVEEHVVRKADSKNEFGLVEEALLKVRPRYLERIELRKLQTSTSVPYSWRLMRHSSSRRWQGHYNLCLDAPTSDEDVFSEDAELYCMPVAFGPRTVDPSSRELICLLLKLEPPPASNPWRCRQFKRFGITKLSELMDSKGQEELREREANEQICLC